MKDSTEMAQVAPLIVELRGEGSAREMGFHVREEPPPQYRRRGKLK